MLLIEPCCVKFHLRMLRDKIEKGATTQFQGYGDLSLTELLPALLTRYSETDMIIMAPAVPDQAAEIIGTCMKLQRAMRTGSGKLNVIKRLTIITDLSEEKSPIASGWIKDNSFGERLVLINKTVAPEEQTLLLPDIAITGPLNMRYGENFVCSVTTVSKEVDELWGKYQVSTPPRPSDTQFLRPFGSKRQSRAPLEWAERTSTSVLPAPERGGARGGVDNTVDTNTPEDTDVFDIID